MPLRRGMMERWVTRAGMGAVFNFHGSLGRNNRQSGETTWNKVDQSWWQVICGFALREWWAGGGSGSGLMILKGFSNLNGSATPWSQTGRSLTSPPSLPGKSSVPGLRSGWFIRRKWSWNFFLDVKILLLFTLKITEKGKQLHSSIIPPAWCSCEKTESTRLERNNPKF